LRQKLLNRRTGDRAPAAQGFGVPFLKHRHGAFAGPPGPDL